METKGSGVAIALGVLAGLFVGGIGGYGLAAKNYGEQLQAISKAAEAKLQQASEQIQKANEQQRALVQQANEQIQKANEQIQKGNEQQKALAQPDLPVRVSFRPSLMGNGQVAQMQNYGPTELAIAVTAKSSATNQAKSWRIVLAPNKVQQIGNMEGWAFATGDELELVEAGFRPLKFRVGN